MLERRVEILEQLPERVTALESQIVQLRDEMRSEFSATRLDLRAEIRAGDGETRREMRELFAASERHARVLHEDVIARIAAISNGR